MERFKFYEGPFKGQIRAVDYRAQTDTDKSFVIDIKTGQEFAEPCGLLLTHKATDVRIKRLNGQAYIY